MRNARTKWNRPHDRWGKGTVCPTFQDSNVGLSLFWTLRILVRMAWSLRTVPVSILRDGHGLSILWSLLLVATLVVGFNQF